MTVVVFDAVSHFPVSDATIKVTGRGSESGIQAGPVLGTYIARSQTYTMTVPAEEPGDWLFTMVVTSTLGEEVLDMPVVLVRGESGVGWTVIGTAVVLIGLLLWFAGRALRKGKQRMSPRPQETAILTLKAGASVMKLINTRVITTALTVVTALVAAACAGGELKEPTFELQVQKQFLQRRNTIVALS